jgi:small subunit ribosomal protein S20
MANIRSQMKRNRQNEKRRMRNRAVRSEVRTRTKAALADGASDEAVREAMKTIDTAAAKGVIHRNEASRRKSRLQKRVNAS